VGEAHVLARGEAGTAGLHELPDGSLVDPDRFAARYSRGEDVPKLRKGDARTETERDRGRLSYSPALRRLAGVTQVVSPDLNAARMHTRESHTHKVALVARELAEHVIRRAHSDKPVAQLIFRAGGLDIAACEAAGLAHDLGHAPFGHAGEVQMHRLLAPHTKDGFEGNPQSFRIVTRLEGGKPGRQAMGLTNVTLCAILKYPWARETPDPQDDVAVKKAKASPSKYGAYDEDSALFEAVRAKVLGDGWETNRRQSLEASIMDLADDIAYAIHDLEDFCAAGMIDLNDVTSKLKDARAAVSKIVEPERFANSGSDDPFTTATGKLRDSYAGLFDDTQYQVALERVEGLISEVLSEASGNSMQAVLAERLGEKVSEYFAGIEIDEANAPYPFAPLVRLNKHAWHDIQVLKVITRHWLIQSPRMGVIQRAQTSAIGTLFGGLVGWLEDENTPEATLPEGLRRALTRAGVNLNAEKLGTLDQRHYRAIGDYMAGLSDSEALLRANWLNGNEIPGMTVVVEAF
jgi:dGTPase